MFCSKCGKKLRDDEVFCSAWGNKVIHENKTNEVKESEAQKDTKSKSKKKSFHLDMIKSICIVFGIILLVVSIYLWTTINSDIEEIKTFSAKYWEAVHNKDERLDTTLKFNNINGEKHDTKIIERQSKIAKNSSTLSEYADNMYDFYMEQQIPETPIKEFELQHLFKDYYHKYEYRN